MKHTTLLLLLILAGIGNNVKAQEQTIYEINVNKLSMQIDAAQGARIISFCYDGQEVLSKTPAPNSFGSTFWTSPQKEWNWPPVSEHDNLPYQVSQNNGVLEMTSQLSEKFPLRIKKKFTTDAGDDCIVVTYTIVNESSLERKVAPWEITRVPAHGSIFFDAPLESITPAGLMNFQQKNGWAWYEIDHTDANRKINADGKGWLSYMNNGLLLIKQFTDLDASLPAPGEAEIQVYVNKGDTYVELESQGAYTLLKPGEQLEWSVRWGLKPM